MRHGSLGASRDAIDRVCDGCAVRGEVAQCAGRKEGCAAAGTAKKCLGSGRKVSAVVCANKSGRNRSWLRQSIDVGKLVV